MSQILIKDTPNFLLNFRKTMHVHPSRPFWFKKYRNAEYTGAACKFWGGKKFFGVQGKIFILQGAINIGFQYWVQYWVEYRVEY